MTAQPVSSLSALTIQEVCAIIAAAENRSRVNKAFIAEHGTTAAVLRAYRGEDHERLALHALISGLAVAARNELMAIMWLGRGDIEPNEFASGVAYAKRVSDDGDVGYICDKSPLVRYLRDGLEKLGLHSGNPT